jgi:hypothetical protein
MLTICLLSFMLQSPQEPVSPLVLESQVPSLTIRFTGEAASDATDGLKHDYKLVFKNISQHQVTALNVLWVSAGTPQKNNDYDCSHACAGTALVGTRADPIIKPGETYDFKVPTDRASEFPAIVLRAALFDDHTFEGDQLQAIFLATSQLGNQSMWERLVPLIENVMADANADDLAKAEQIRLGVNKLSTEPDSAMIKAFRAEFPHFTDVMTFEQMKNNMRISSAAVKRTTLERLESFSSGRNGSRTLAQWWEATKWEIHSYGCAGCSQSSGF